MRLTAPIHHLKRKARQMARAEDIPLHTALDRVAQSEGFAAWSLLSARMAGATPAGAVLAQARPGEMFLIAARPGQGKTLLGLQVLLDALEQGRHATLFTLEYTEAQAAARFRALGATRLPEIVASDGIDAATIIRQLSDAPRGSVAVIDYLQILDQPRSTPPLEVQVRDLHAFARERGVILGFISQVDRHYDPARAPRPGFADIRLPNPVPEGAFARACFLQGGEVRLETAG